MLGGNGLAGHGFAGGLTELFARSRNPITILPDIASQARSPAPNPIVYRSKASRRWRERPAVGAHGIRSLPIAVEMNAPIPPPREQTNGGVVIRIWPWR